MVHACLVLEATHVCLFNASVAIRYAICDAKMSQNEPFLRMQDAQEKLGTPIQFRR